MKTIPVLLLAISMALSVGIGGASGQTAGASAAGTAAQPAGGAAGVSATPTSAGARVTYTTHEPGLEPADPKALDQRKAAWLEAWSGVSTADSATVFAEVDMSSEPPPDLVITRPLGSLAMKVMARATRTNWTQVMGVQVFSESPSPPPPYDWAGIFMGVLDTLTPDQWHEVVGEGVPIDQLSPSSATSLMAAVAGGYSYLSPRLLDRPDTYRLRLEFLPLITWDDSKGPHQFFITLKPPPVPAPSPPLGAPAPFKVPFLPLQKAPAGPLSFGKGEVLRLRDILAKAEGVFQTRYSFDIRLYRTWYFVRGTFTRASFDQAVQAAAATAAVQERPPRHGDYHADIVALINGRAGEILEHKLEYGNEFQPTSIDLGVSPSEFMAGGAVPISRIAAGSLPILDYFRYVGLGPDSLVTLHAGLLFDVDGGGMIHVPIGIGGYDLRNQFKLGVP